MYLDIFEQFTKCIFKSLARLSLLLPNFIKIWYSFSKRAHQVFNKPARN